jgi:hypothetical protein
MAWDLSQGGRWSYSEWTICNNWENSKQLEETTEFFENMNKNMGTFGSLWKNIKHIRVFEKYKKHVFFEQ